MQQSSANTMEYETPGWGDDDFHSRLKAPQDGLHPALILWARRTVARSRPLSRTRTSALPARVNIPLASLNSNAHPNLTLAETIPNPDPGAIEDHDHNPYLP